MAIIIYTLAFVGGFTIMSLELLGAASTVRGGEEAVADGRFAKMFIEKTSPLLYRVLGVFLPLITTNCAVLGVALQNTNKAHNFTQSTLYGFGAALGFSLVLVLFSALRERLAAADVPVPFKGAAVGMITAGLMSLAFMGFAGLV